MAEKFVKVPVRDIEKLEQARLELFNMLQAQAPHVIKYVTTVTGPMHQITHRKYEEITND